MLDLKNVESAEEIITYSEALANDIEAGITDDNGICNAELICDFVEHCARVAVARERKQTEQRKIETAFENLQVFVGTLNKTALITISESSVDICGHFEAEDFFYDSRQFDFAENLVGFLAELKQRK
jgi:hypothetical protein